MLRSVLLKTLRDQRTSALAWGAGLGLLVILIAAAWAHAYPTEASRTSLAELVESGLSVAEVLYGQPHHVNLLPGWVEWRAIGGMRVLLAIVAVLTAARVTRGAEEEGTLECVAAASSQSRVFLQQVASVLAGLAVTCGLLWLAMLAAGPAAGEATVNPLDSLLLAVNLYLAIVLAAGLALLAGQFTTSRRTAALTAGAVVIAMHIWDNLAAITPAIEGARPLSPFYLYSVSAPLSEGHVNLLAFGGLALVDAGTLALACWLAARRDLRGVVKLPWRPARAAEGPATLTAAYFRQELGLRSPFLRGLADSRVSIAAWGAGLAVLTALLAAVAPGMREAWADRASRSALSGLIGTGTITENAVVSFTVFGFLPLLVSLFALTLAAAWASEEINGRLELELAAPLSRAAIFLQRLAASVSAILPVIGLAGVGLFATAALAGVHLDWAGAALSLLLLVPLATTVLAFGYFMAGAQPRLVVGVGAALLVGSYFIELLVTLFGWPSALSYASVFHLYGRPLLDGPDWPSTLALLAMTGVLAAAGSASFNRRDISR